MLADLTVTTNQKTKNNSQHGDLDILTAATKLTIMSLCVGSPVEIYCKAAAYNRFWTAYVLYKETDGFWYIFEDTENEI